MPVQLVVPIQTQNRRAAQCVTWAGSPARPGSRRTPTPSPAVKHTRLQINTICANQPCRSVLIERGDTLMHAHQADADALFGNENNHRHQHSKKQRGVKNSSHRRKQASSPVESTQAAICLLRVQYKTTKVSSCIPSRAMLTKHMTHTRSAASSSLCNQQRSCSARAVRKKQQQQLVRSKRQHNICRSAA